MAAEAFSVTTKDGVSIAGTFRDGKAPARPLVVLLHGFSSSQDNGTNRGLLPLLDSVGCGSLTFDFRGCGKSGGDLGESTISTGRLDLSAAMEWVQAKHPGWIEGSIVFVGSSYGGAVALAASHDYDPETILLKAPTVDIPHGQLLRRGPDEMRRWRERGYIDYDNRGETVQLRYSYVEDAERYDLITRKATPAQTRIFTVQGTADEVAPLEDTRRFVAADPGKRELREIMGADHHFGGPGQFDEMIAYVRGRLRDAVQRV